MALFKLTFFAFLFFCALASASPSAQAGFDFWPFQSRNDDFTPYLDDPKIPHNSQWAGDPWEPSDWKNAAGSSNPTIQKLYAANIITDQYREDDTPVLEVGHSFMRLAGEDQRRVASFFDQAYGITKSDPNAAIYVYYKVTDEPIGIYTLNGLQLQ
jgi:hypothetical protein